MKRIPRETSVILLGMLLLVAGAVIVGCVAAEPPMLVEPLETAPAEEDAIKGEPTVAVDETAMTAEEEAAEASDEEAATPEPLIAQDPRVDALQSTIAQIQTSLEDLQAAQNVTTSEVRALDDRVGKIEQNIETIAENVESRFGNFDAAIQEIRAAMASGMAMSAGSMGSGMMMIPNPEAEGGRDIEAEVAIAVDTWRDAWQGRDLKTYLAAYSPKARVTRLSLVNGGTVKKRTMDVKQLRARMQQLLRQYARMEVIVRGFRVQREGDRMVATFQQEFTAWTRPRDLRPVYTDKGVKTLVFEESSDGRWLIVEENWVPIQR